MGHKVNPVAFRLGYSKDWRARWYAGKGQYAVWLKEDILIRSFLADQLKNAALSTVEIERSPQHIEVILHSSRPGVIIGRSGEQIDKLKKRIAKMTTSQLKLSIHDIRKPDLDATLVAQNIVSQIERRIPFRRAIKQSVERVLQAGAKGVKVMVAGRLNGAEIARSEALSQGNIPLQTLRADIDYVSLPAQTTFGTIGVKVWIYNGDRLGMGDKKNQMDAPQENEEFKPAARPAKRDAAIALKKASK